MLLYNFQCINVSKGTNLNLNKIESYLIYVDIECLIVVIDVHKLVLLIWKSIFC